MKFSPRLLSLLACLFALATCTPRPASAQLAQSFYNIVGIDTKTLPNGIQITVRADGAINMGVDIKEFLNFDVTGNSSSSAITQDSFRLRFVGARAQIPAYTDIGAYPADFADATLGRDELTGFPFFYSGQDASKTDPTLPRVDLRFHFYVPIKVNYFTFIYGQDYGWNYARGGLQPREASIAVSSDRRSVVITVISDRVETVRGQSKLIRSPAARQNHRLTVAGGASPDAPLHIDSLHSPLAQVADEIAHATGIPLVVPAAEGALDVTLYLPAANREDALRTLALACGLTLQPRPADEGGGDIFARGGSSGADRISERIPLHYLRPDSARLLLPDFLLPRLHVDAEHNALVVSGNAEIIARIRHDLALLDRPRPQVRVEATVYEIQRSDADSLGLQATIGHVALDTAAETVAATVQTGLAQKYAAALDALVARSRARLVARPSLTVVSGESGTLFAGQARYITVLQNDGSGGQNVQAIKLPVGTSLTVTPTASAPPTDGAAPSIVLDLGATVATVDAIETKTGLPTVGTRQISSEVRLTGNGDAVLLAGLSVADESQTHRRFATGLSRLPLLGPLIDKLMRSHDTANDSTELIVLVTAQMTNGNDAATLRGLGEKL